MKLAILCIVATSTLVAQNSRTIIAVSCYNKGNKFMEKEQYDSAVYYYSKSIDLNIDQEDVYDYRGYARIETGDFKGAVEDITIALQHNPMDARLYNNRGFAKNGLKKFEDAIKDFDKTIDLDPTYAYAYNNRGNAYLGLGNIAKACANWQLAVAHDYVYKTEWKKKYNLDHPRDMIKKYCSP